MTNKEKLQNLMEQAKELSGQISEDELNEIVGGDRCACFLGGGGSAGGNDKTCACVAIGVGESKVKNGAGTYLRCDCVVGGEGKNTN